MMLDVFTSFQFFLEIQKLRYMDTRHFDRFLGKKEMFCKVI